MQLFSSIFDSGADSKPIEIITRGVDNMAQGNLRHRIHLTSDELYHLGQSINELAETLENNLIDIIDKTACLGFDTTVNGIFSVSQYAG